jgi:hypothetical protein
MLGGVPQQHPAEGDAASGHLQKHRGGGIAKMLLRLHNFNQLGWPV